MPPASRTVIVLVTNNYPFGQGEEFLAPEIPHLCEAADELVLVATKCGSDPQTRTLPSNARAVRADGGRPRGRLIPGLAARGFAGLLSAGRLSAREPRRLAADALFEGQARRSLRRLEERYDELGLRAGDRVILYSYWLHTPARVAELARELVATRTPEATVARTVSRAHGYDLYLDAAPFGHLPQRRELFAALDEIYPISQRGVDYLIEHWPQVAAKVHRARLGTPDPGGLGHARQTPVHLLTLGGLVAIKRTDRLPGVLQALQDRGITATWTHWGDGASRAELRSAAAAVVGADQVHLDGAVPHDEVLPRLRDLRATCLVNTSRSEGVPVSMMEACSVGLPVVAPAVGGVPEVVHDQVNGFLVDPDFSDDQMAAAIQKLAESDAGAYQQMRDAARKVWATDFDSERNLSEFAATITR